MKFKSEVQLEALNNATIDTDKFLVSDSTTVKFRTGAQVLSDIGGQSALTNPITGTGTTNYLPKFTGTSTLGNSLVFDNGTNVGIGTTSPDYKLDVEGDISLVGAGENYAVMSPISQGMQIAVGDPADTATPLVTFHGDQKVGIGTASPNRKLTVQNGSYTFPAGIDPNSFFAIANDGWAGMNILSSSGTGGFIDFGDLDGGYRGRILYGQGTDYMAFDTSGSTKMTILSSGNVGIGTTSPTAKLDIREANRVLNGYGNINIFSTDAFAANLGGSIALGGTSNTTGGTSPYPFAKIQGIKEGTANWSGALLFGTTNSNSSVSEKMRIDSSGNVGIGTTSPSTRLEIVGSYAVTPLKVLRHGDYGNVINIGRNGVSETANIGYPADSTINLSTGGSERMRITSAGNVGIGTATPNSKLEVTGNVSINNQLTSLGDQLILNCGSEEIVINNAGSQIYTLTQEFGIGTSSPDYKLDVIGNGIRNIRSTAGWAGWFENTNNSSGVIVTAGVDSGDAPLLIRKQNGTELFSVRGDGTSWFSNGNVGIGTTSPSEKLSVNGNIESLDTFVLNYANNGIKWQQLFDGANSWNLRYYNGTAWSNSAITVKANGNVGIGTTSPYGKLDIKNATLNGGFEFFPDNSTDTNLIINYDRIANTYMNLQTRAATHQFLIGSTEKMRISSTGNVGIGTTSPAKGLQLESNSDEAKRSIRLAYDSLYYWDVKQTGAGGVQYNAHNATSGGHTFDINGNEKFRITYTGNVGIGTTSPIKKLDVRGEIMGTAYSLYDAINEDYATILSTYANYLVISDGGGYFSGIHFETAGDIIATLNSSGNVGIGTTSPSQKLQVNGIGEFAGALRITETGTSQNILIGNQDGGGTNTPAMINGVNGNLRFGKGNSWSGEGGTFTEAMRITSSGNVGIGTTSPSQKLEVAGKLLVDNGDLGSVAGDTIYHAEITGTRHHLDFKEVRTANDSDWKNTTYKLQMRVDSTNHQSIDFVSDASYNKHIDIYTGNQVFNTRFNTNGNVGIGTTSPAEKLQVNGNVMVGDDLTVGSFVDVIGAGGSQDFGFRFGTESDRDNKAAILANTSGAGLKFFTNGATERMCISSAGNVGIGTTSPQKLLHVSSNDQATARIRISNTNTGDGGDDIELVAGVHNTTQDGFSIYNATAGSTSLVIQGGGNVGIGTTNPGYQLQLSTNSAAKPTSNVWTVVSDRRVKENIRPYTSGLDKILQIEPKLFDYNGKAGFDKTKDNVGIIAQDMAEIMPETINKYKAKLNQDDELDTELYNFDGHAVTFALINSVKELQNQITDLKLEIQTLKNK